MVNNTFLNLTKKLDTVLKNITDDDSTQYGNSARQFTGTSSQIFEIIFLAPIGVLILLGNVLVILAFAKGPRRIRTLTNYYVINLAVSDIFVGCLSVPIWICLKIEILESNSYFTGLDILFGTTSIFSLTAISLERLFAVRHPTTHFNLSKKPVYISIALTWIFGFIFFTISVFILNYEDFTATLFALAFLLPLIIIVASYIGIFISAHNLKFADNASKTLSRDIRIAKTISVIIGLFVICWAPFFTVNMLYFFCDSCQRFDWALAVSIVKSLHYSNSMMNFFVYAVRSPDFRETFKALIFKCNTDEVRDRLRSVSFSTMRKRLPSMLAKKVNNSGSIADITDNKSRLIYKNTLYDQNTEHMDISTAYSESPSINFLVYDS